MERIADYIIESLVGIGITHIYLVTGRGILYLSDAVAKNNGISGVSTLHEQGASYAAMAYSAAKNAPAACLVSTGCAATNAVTAALCAYQDNLPIIFISGQNMLDETTRHTEVNIRTYGSQEADIISVVKPITKYAVMLENADNTVYEMEKSINIATSGRKGPVWIDIPLDVQNMRIEPTMLRHYVANDVKYDIDYDVSRVAVELSGALRPVILIGGGIASSGAENEITALIEKTNIPLVFSPTASDIYGICNKLSIGAVGSIGGSRAGNFVLQNSDYVLAIGTKLCSQETGIKENFAHNAKVTIVDIDPNEHKKNGVHTDNIIISDARYFISKLMESGLDVKVSNWTNLCLRWKELFSIKNEPFVKEIKEKDKVDLYSLMDELNDCLPNDATVITDAGFEELVVPSSLAFRKGQRCLFPASQGAMGYAIPAILGAYDAGRKHIIVIVGDGSFMMNVQELQIISSRHIPAKIIIINNDMYAVIRKRQTDLFRSRTIGTDSSNGVPEPDFCRLADCFGCKYRKITSRTELLESKQDILSENGNLELIEIKSVMDQKYFHESYMINANKRLEHRPIEDMAPFLDREVIEKEMVIKS